MTESPVDSDCSVPNGPEQQALDRISGIGETWQQRLKSIGIQTLQDLAKADTKSIEDRLEAIGHSANHNKITVWISQAQALVRSAAANEAEGEGLEAEKTAADSNLLPAEESEPEVEESSQVSPMVEIVETEAVSTIVKETQTLEWTKFSSFIVEFEAQQIDKEMRYQTAVRHIETDQTETWPGIEEEGLKSWLREHLVDTIPATPGPTEALMASVKTQFIVVFEDLLIYQPPTSGMPMGIYKPSLMFPSPIRSNLPFTLELKFRVQDKEAFENIEKDVSYTVECYARSLIGKEVLALGKVVSKPLPYKQYPYTVLLPAINLQPGIFRLQILLNLQGADVFPVLFEVPALQVD